MEYKRGYKLVCIKAYGFYKPYKQYVIFSAVKNHTFYISKTLLDNNGVWFDNYYKNRKSPYCTQKYLWKYFCDIKEYRKLKLEKLNGIQKRR